MHAQMILPAVEQLKSLAEKTCEKHSLNFNYLNTYSSPRRLAIELSGLPDKENDQKVELKGPPLSVAKDDQNNWTKAAKGFAKKNNVPLKIMETKKIEGKDLVLLGAVKAKKFFELTTVDEINLGRNGKIKRDKYHNPSKIVNLN